jgi:hypothetical protein
MLNPNNSEAPLVGTHQQRSIISTVRYVPLAGADLSIITCELKSLGVIIDFQLPLTATCTLCVWHATFIYEPQRQRVQNNFARIVIQAPRHTSAIPLLYQLHELPVEHQLTYKVALLTHKIHTQSTLLYLRDLLMNHCSVRTLPSADTPTFVIPYVRTVTANRAFWLAAPTVWSSLPHHVSTHLFNVAFKPFISVHT